jgi:hypothetical protein
VPKTMPDTEKPFTCVARRHMRAAMFMTYDAMVAMCKSDEDYEPGDELVFWGSEKKLGNMNNRSAEQESQALGALANEGWIIPIQTEQSRFSKGRWTTNKYRVVEHAEYIATHGPCPPLLYGPKTGDKLKPGRLAPALERKWIQKITGVEWPDFMADAIADSIAAKKK